MTYGMVYCVVMLNVIVVWKGMIEFEIMALLFPENYTISDFIITLKK